MFSWNLVTHILSNEITWIFVAFVALVVGGYKPVKNMLFQQLDIRINEAKNGIEQAIALKQTAVQKLEQLQESNRKALAESEMIIKNARDEAQKILREAQEKASLLEQKTSDFIDEQNEIQIKIMLENVKRDVLLSVVNIAETKLQPALKNSDPTVGATTGNAVDELSALFKNIKRVWN